MTSLVQMTDAARELAIELLERFGAHSQEAQQLALQMIQAREARLTLHLILAGDAPAMTLLLEPTAEVGAPIEIASSCPVPPTPEGFEARQWFFRRLSHWNMHH